MRNQAIPVLLGLAVLAGAASPAHAAWTDDRSVEAIRQSRSTHNSGRTNVTLTGLTCAAGGFFIADDVAATEKEAQVSMLVAALLSGRPVRLGYTVVNDGCSVWAVVLK